MKNPRNKIGIKMGVITHYYDIIYISKHIPIYFSSEKCYSTVLQRSTKKGSWTKKFHPISIGIGWLHDDWIVIFGFTEATIGSKMEFGG